MIVQNNNRSTTSIRLLCEVASNHGVSVQSCLEGTGLSIDHVEDFDTQHATEQEILAIQNLVRQIPDQAGLGWAVGSKMHINSFGIWGFAIQTSPTLRAAIKTSIEFINLSFIIADMRLVETGEDSRLIFDMTGLPPDTHRFLFERHSAVALNFVKELELTKIPAQFRLETIDDDADYVKSLSSISALDVASNQPAYAIVFSSNLLEQSLSKADPNSLRFCLDQCRAMLKRDDEAIDPWSQKVKNLIVEDVGSEQKIEDICAALSITERTLRRRLDQLQTALHGCPIGAGV